MKHYFYNNYILVYTLNYKIINIIIIIMDYIKDHHYHLLYLIFIWNNLCKILINYLIINIINNKKCKKKLLIKNYFINYMQMI